MPTVGNQNRSVTLDVVRGVAILAVVTVHSFQASVAASPTPIFTDSHRIFVGFSYLRFGVELFYLLSGYLMFSIYRKNRNETGIQYLAKRAGRIWPLWIVFTLLSFTTLVIGWNLSPVDGRFSGDSYGQWVVAFVIAIFFLGWLSPELWNVPAGGWSIQVEIGHYSLFWFLRKSRDVTLLVSVLIGYSTYFLAQYVERAAPSDPLQSFATSWIRLGLYGTWPFFVAGGLVVIWSRTTSAGKRPEFLSLALTGVVLVAAWWVPIPFGMTYEAVLTSLVLLGVTWVFLRWNRSIRGSAILGRYSYFIYFAHFWVIEIVVAPLYRLTESLGLSNVFGFWVLLLLVFTVSIALSLAAAIPSWKFFESRWIAKSRKVSLKDSM